MKLLVKIESIKFLWRKDKSEPVTAFYKFHIRFAASFSCVSAKCDFEEYAGMRGEYGRYDIRIVVPHLYAASECVPWEYAVQLPSSCKCHIEIALVDGWCDVFSNPYSKGTFYRIQDIWNHRKTSNYLSLWKTMPTMATYRNISGSKWCRMCSMISYKSILFWQHFIQTFRCLCLTR